MNTSNRLFIASFIAYSLVFASGCGSKSSSNDANPEAIPESTEQELPQTWQKTVTTSFVNLDAATDFNLFLFGNLDQPSADTEGSIAVGGNAILANYSVGETLPLNLKRYDLVVGGNLDFKSGAVLNGATIVAGKINSGSTSFKGGIKQGSSPVNFALAQKNIAAESQRLSQLSTTGKIKFEDWNQERGELTLDGQKNLNVFNIDAQTLARAHTLRISAPQNAYVVVNISGKKAILKSMGMSITGTVRNRVLFNFINADNLEIAEISFEGSILAPYASINFSTGVIRGQVIAHSVMGSGQFNNDPIDGNHPQPPTPPTPVTPAPPIPVDPEPQPQPQPPALPDNPEVPYL
jgi:choice-of-anchor A domain-containing protein